MILKNYSGIYTGNGAENITIQLKSGWMFVMIYCELEQSNMVYTYNTIIPFLNNSGEYNGIMFQGSGRNHITTIETKGFVYSQYPTSIQLPLSLNNNNYKYEYIYLAY